MISSDESPITEKSVSIAFIRSFNEDLEPRMGKIITRRKAQSSASSEKPPTCAAVTKANIPMNADETYGLNLIARANNEKGLVSACRILM